MSIKEQLDQITAYVGQAETDLVNIKSALISKKVTVPDSTKLKNVPDLIAKVETGTKLRITITTDLDDGTELTAKRQGSDDTVTGTVSGGQCSFEVSEPGLWVVEDSDNNSVQVEIPDAYSSDLTTASKYTLTIEDYLPKEIDPYYDTNPIKVQVYFYKKSGQIITEPFMATNYDHQSEEAEVRSGDIVQISSDHPLVVKEVPNGTGYRVTLYENFYMFSYSDNVVSLTGKVDGDTNNKFTVTKMGQAPDLYPIFEVKTDSPELDTKEFTFDLTLQSDDDQSGIEFPEQVKTTGPGFVCVPVHLTMPGTFHVTVKQSGNIEGVTLDQSSHVFYLTGEIDTHWNRTVTDMGYDSESGKIPFQFSNTKQ